MRRGDWVREQWIDASELARHEGLDWSVYVSQGVIDLCAPAGAASGSHPREAPAAVRTAWYRNVAMVVRGLAIALGNVAKPGPFFCCAAWWEPGYEPAPAHFMLYDVLRDGAVKRYCVRVWRELLPDDPRRPPGPAPAMPRPSASHPRS